MATLEQVGRETWKDLVGAPIGFLMLGRSDCGKWTTELQGFLESEDAAAYAAVRFGTMVLDERGLGEFKKANPWLAEVEYLPYNLLYKDGERVKDWPGGGLDRLLNRLRRLTGESG